MWVQVSLYVSSYGVEIFSQARLSLENLIFMYFHINRTVDRTLAFFRMWLLFVFFRVFLGRLENKFGQGILRPRPVFSPLSQSLCGSGTGSGMSCFPGTEVCHLPKAARAGS